MAMDEVLLEQLKQDGVEHLETLQQPVLVQKHEVMEL